MKQVIDQITDRLAGLIEEDQPSYTPQQLLKAGIPSYIVERIRMRLEDIVLSDLSKPKSGWINPNNALFDQAWEDFKNSAVSCSVIPVEKLKDILQHTVNDIISVFVEPRKNMALYLFRNEQLLSLEQMTKRCERLTIYKHFGKAIPLYMQKRELSEISLERCQKLIANLDARIVSNYSAEDWAKKLEMLFTLFGGKLDPKLVSLFFKDKGYDGIAKTFADLDVLVTQSMFVEMLSSDKIDFVLNETSTDVDAEEVQKTVQVKDPFDDETGSEKEEAENLASAFQQKAPEPEINEILGDISSDGIIETDNMEEAESLNALFSEEEVDEEYDTGTELSFSKEEEQEELRSNLTSILDQAKDSFDGVTKETVEEDEILVEEELIEDPVDEIHEEQDEIQEEVAEESDEEAESDEEEKPMWAQFLSEGQMEVMMASREEEAEEKPDTESINDALFVEDEDDELVIEAPQENSNTVPLNGYLHEKEAEWIQALFDGNNKEYHSAIDKIEALKNWKKASEYVETNIFGKEHVDMFSDEAVGFIDVLQTYFKKYKS